MKDTDDIYELLQSRDLIIKSDKNLRKQASQFRSDLNSRIALDSLNFKLTQRNLLKYFFNFEVMFLFFPSLPSLNVNHG